MGITITVLEQRTEAQITVWACDKDAQGFVVEDIRFQTVFLDENAQEGVRFVAASDKA